MSEQFALSVNGKQHTVDADGNTALLYILRNDLKLKGTRFGCGAGHCGACTVLLDNKAVQSCDTPLWSAVGHEISTIEGLGDSQSPGRLQQAFIDLQAAQCGYCINGIIMAAEALLRANPNPTDAEIVAALERNLCRCGTHLRVLKAIRKAVAAQGAGR
ncbi:MAG: (2Fe-2S)-binding protein [Hylemonella sp.]